MKQIKFVLFCLIFTYISNVVGQSPGNKVKKTVLQAFWWDYKNDNFPNAWADYLISLAPRLKSMGFDAIWIPPSYKNQSPNWVGYGPMDHYDLGDKFQKGSPNVYTGLGTKDELLRMIAVMHANGIEVIQDIVLNHVDGAGTSLGESGVDDAALSLQSNNGYKNFRYASFATPAIDESEDDYFTRNGRWSKNYLNFYPNSGNPCCTNDINSPYFGPDIAYEINSIGQSSNIPTSGSPPGYGSSRPYFNPVQPDNYMRDGARNWMLWFKKQSGVDGLRWDAVKHFPIPVQEDLIYNVKYSLPAWAAGGQTMLNIGEWIGSKGDIDGYVNNVATGCAPIGDTNNGCSTGSGREEHTGTFDFSLRGYSNSGGLYSMIRGNGGFDVSVLPAEQQSKRYFDYSSINTRVHRSFTFVNSHDTYRPLLTANGDFQSTLSNSYSTGWNFGSELGGNGGHLDPREPRMPAAYAVIMAMDGNPVVFFEDVFDIGTTGKRWAHDPTLSTELPVWNDLDNLLLSHQKLRFKDGDYKVRTAENSPSPYFVPGKGDATDHIVFEREGKAIIGVTDFYSNVSDNSNDREVYVNTSFPIGTELYDFSGAHGIAPVTVTDHLGNTSISRVLIKTAPVGHTISGSKGHGYSIWAPLPIGVTVDAISDFYDYLATYSTSRNPVTTQEWEMDNDLGDSHCLSLGQGGQLPANSCNQRVVGKIYVEQGQSITMTLTPTNLSEDLTLMLYDKNGSRLKKVNGVGILTDTYVPQTTGWITAKIKNTVNTNLGQKCYVRLAYTAPQFIMNPVADSAANMVYIWTSNAGSSTWSDCGNWEEGRWPQNNTGTVIIPECVDHQPIYPQGFSGLIMIEPLNVALSSSQLSLTLSVNSEHVDLSWKVDNMDVHFFKILRSNDGKYFKELGKVDADRTSNVAARYFYADKEVEINGKYYYQVLAFDHEGNQYNSNIEVAIFDAKNSISIHPNPASNFISVDSHHSDFQDGRLMVYDLTGRMVWHGEMQFSKEIDISNFTQGVYLLKIIKTNGQVFNLQFVKY